MDSVDCVGTENSVDRWDIVDGRGGVSGIDGDGRWDKLRDVYDNSRDNGSRLKPATTSCWQQHTHQAHQG